MVTLKDIAKEVNVSYTAVSFVLGERSKPGKVSLKTRAKINEVATRMGYRRNAVASNMRHGKTKIIAFLGHNIAKEYVARVIQGVCQSIDANHFFMKLIPVEHDKDFRQSMERLLEQRPAGVIVRGLTNSQNELFSHMLKGNLPVACIENYNEPSGDVNIFSDDKAGMHLAVEYLHGLGHIRIAHISNDLNSGFSAKRYRGFCKGMEKCRLMVDNTLLFDGEYRKKAEEFYKFIKDIVSGRLSATAICCASDYQALAAMNIIQSLGKRVPEDISITGYGNLEFCGCSFPTLTTVRQPFKEMGMAAANNLIKVIKGETFQSRIEIPTELMLHNSTGVAKKNINKF